MTEHVIINEVKEQCPSCGVTVIFDLDTAAVFHPLPTCDGFDQRDALEYARFVRESKEKPSGERAHRPGKVPKITIEIPKLELAADLGGQNQIGYERFDLPLFHTIARAPGGTLFQLHGHFDHCAVCKEHGVTLAHFDEFMDRQRGD